uniref:Uncharacterized protein n=1 Tax=Vannella robusta TaxID=1487602 RepID=A0A7S4IVB8_9EUKA
MGLDGSQVEQYSSQYFPSLVQYHTEINAIARIVSFLMIFVCNAMQINFSAKCLDQSSSVVAVVTITGLNFFFSVCAIRVTSNSNNTRPFSVGYVLVKHSILLGLSVLSLLSWGYTSSILQQL